VVLFVPVIPLGRKRIIDQCPRCSRHFVADQAKYEMARQLSVSGVLEQYRSQPTPEAALEAHATLLSYHMYTEANRFREAALQEHSQSGELHVGLAAHLDQVGRHNDSIPLLKKAYDLSPDLPPARVAISRLCMADGNLAEARRLLSFLEQPGAAELYSLEPLEALAMAYQRQGQHDQTLALCKHLLSEVPRVGQVARFRKFVKVSERALNRAESILPAWTFSLRRLLGRSRGQGTSWLRRLAWAAVLGGAALMVTAGLNEYWRRNRRVIAVNDCGQPVQMTIDDNAPQQVQGTKFLNLAEGTHHVMVSGPINEEFDVEMATGYFQRFADNPAWVIMVGRGTVLVEEMVHYSATPRPSQGKLIVGRNFYYASHVDYCFQSPPHSIQSDNKVSVVTKICLRRLSEPSHVLIGAVAAEDPSAALRFGETRLIGVPDDVPLLEAYVQIADAAKETERARSYLKAGLDRRPICVAWHRAYQEAGKTGKQQAALEQEYDALLHKSPRDASLLYLAARVATDRKKALELFHRSHVADPKLAWPCFALAYDAASCGDWPTCRSLAHDAVTLENYPASKRLLREARLALREFDALENEDRQAVAAAGGHDDLMPVLDLCEVLVARNRRDEALETLEAWQRRQSAQNRSASTESLGRLLLQYMVGDFHEAQVAGSGDLGKASSEFRLQILLADGRVKDALGDDSLKELLADPWNALAVSVAWSIAGDSREASAWRDKATTALDQLGADSQRAAEMLRAARPPDKDRLDNIVLRPTNKSLLIAAAIERFPGKKSELAPVARDVNVSRYPPYHLVRRAIGDSPGDRRSGAGSPEGEKNFFDP